MRRCTLRCVLGLLSHGDMLSRPPRMQVVGRLAQQIATILQGKDKPIYNPKKNLGDVVVVINAAHVHLTHDKWDTKEYRWHTGAASSCVHPAGPAPTVCASQCHSVPRAAVCVHGLLMQCPIKLHGLRQRGRPASRAVFRKELAAYVCWLLGARRVRGHKPDCMRHRLPRSRKLHASAPTPHTYIHTAHARLPLQGTPAACAHAPRASSGRRTPTRSCGPR